ncbi:hypothetical protein [uncultured Clostridium sp.]|uniref:hypothetical protein n=1 Tax=uncultured Clostridium sp. TaxID=59620 RepID=UPI0025D9DE76|nr:hypothetical protein [uncultured Clostridium sp.]
MNLDKKKLLEYLKCIPSATIPEILNLLPNILGGSLGISLSFIGNTILNLRNNIEIKESIERLGKKINDLSREQQEKVKEELRKVCTIQIENLLNAGTSEMYTIDGLEIILRNEDEDYNSISQGILEAVHDEDSLIYQLVDTAYTSGNKIVINLLEPKNREVANQLIDEIDRLIKELCGTLWNRSMIKKITFY